MYGAFLRCLFLTLPIWKCSTFALPANSTYFTLPPPSPISTGSSWPPVGVVVPVDYSHYPPESDEYMAIMSYGASSHPSAVLSNPILDGIQTIMDEKLLDAGLPTDGRPFTIGEGPVLIHFTLVQPVIATKYELQRALARCFFWTFYDSPREVDAAKVLKLSREDPDEYKITATLRLELLEGNVISVKKKF